MIAHFSVQKIWLLQLNNLKINKIQTGKNMKVRLYKQLDSWG